MRVLVTGATGLIGSAVCDALLARGDEVVGLSRDPAKARKTNPTVTWHAWDPANERPPAAALDGVDAVVNLVGEEINQRLTDEAKQRIRESRVRATKNLVDGMLAATPSPRTLVSQAAIGYLRRPRRGDRRRVHRGRAQGSSPSSWSSGRRRRAGRRPAASAWWSSAPGSSSTRRAGCSSSSCRRSSSGSAARSPAATSYMPWIHRDDEVGLILWALDNAAVSGTLNATAPNPVTNREFSKSLGKALHRPSLIPAPRFAIRALRGEELTEQIVGSYRVIPRRAQDLGYAFRFPELDPALADLL